MGEPEKVSRPLPSVQPFAKALQLLKQQRPYPFATLSRDVADLELWSAVVLLSDAKGELAMSGLQIYRGTSKQLMSCCRSLARGSDLAG